MATSATHTSATPLTGTPACPKCSGRMWDNRASKRNPKAPDFKCRDRSCDGVLWPGQHKAAEPVITPRRVAQDEAPEGRAQEGQQEQSEGRGASGSADRPARAALRRCYLDVTDFVLREVRPKYQDAGVPCTDATIAAIAATLFIATCRAEGA